MREYSSLELESAVAELFKKCEDLLSQKNSDYNPDGVAFRAVDKVASDIDIPSYRVLYIFLIKHLESIRAYMKHGKLESTESIESRIQDAINYLALIWVDICKRREIK